MRGLRRNSLTVQCAWCERILSNSQWIPERRSPSKAKYTHGICDRCFEKKAYDFKDWPRILKCF